MPTKLLSVKSIAVLRNQLRQWRADGLRVALVPTMGNLHEGHFSLIHVARQHADRVVASVFVNPAQFGPNEDYSAYPRTPDADAAGLTAAGCDLLFEPSVELMYPDTSLARTQVEVLGLSDILCGAVRPGHFVGVATVVAKLFNLTQPDVAVFGAKDCQQLLVIQRMVRELSFVIEIIGAPIVREANGLAMSSRNQYLNPTERAHAGFIYATLLQMRDNWRSGASIAGLETQALAALGEAGFKPDYAVLRSAETLEAPTESSVELVALIAARLGKARLIDNLRWRR